MMSRGARGGIVAAGVLALVAACTAPARSNAPSDPPDLPPSPAWFTLLPGVIVEPDRNRVYLMRPGGGIEAVDLDQGGVRWTSDRADQPLLMAGGLLLARVESTVPGIMLRWFDPEGGDSSAGSDEPIVLPLPSGLAAPIDQTMERSFTFWVRAGGDEIYLIWEFIERDLVGVSPPGGRAFARRETGAFRYLDGRFEAMTVESIPARAWPAAVRELVNTGQLARAPWRAGQVLAAAQQRYDPDRLVLRRWRPGDGAEMAESILYPGRAKAVLASCDERHIVVAVASGRSPPAPTYLQRFHALRSGELVAQVPSARSAGPFCLFDQRLLHLAQPELRRVGEALVTSPLALIASDPESAAEIWRRPLRDTAFRGSAPPRS